MAEQNTQSLPSSVSVTFVNGVAVENPAPKVVHSGDGPTPGAPQQPGLALSQVANTSVGFANDNLSHVCDFVSEMQKNIELKKFIKSQAQNIRKAIRAILRALGLTDATGETSWLANTLKSIQTEINYVNKQILQPILDFEKYVLAYITKLRNIISWILSLPAKFLALLQDCLARVIKLIGSIFTDIGAGLSEGFSEGPSDYNEIIKEAKALASAASDTVKASVAIVGGAANIAVAGTVGLLIPTNQAELDAANATIAAYEAPAIPSSQNRSAP
jgi:hypothetical protein